MELENNAYFWQKLDILVMSSDMAVEREKDSHHPDYGNMIYPVDYGYIRSDSRDNKKIGFFRGSNETYQVQAIAVCADILKKDLEVKLLFGCSEDEINSIMLFLNQSDFQKCILIRRGTIIPSWAEND